MRLDKGNQTHAARFLGLARPTLKAKLDECGISADSSLSAPFLFRRRVSGTTAGTLTVRMHTQLATSRHRTQKRPSHLEINRSLPLCKFWHKICNTSGQRDQGVVLRWQYDIVGKTCYGGYSMPCATRIFGAAAATLLILSLPVRAAPTLDLSTAGSGGFVNGAYFQQTDVQPTGSGYIQSFVRLSTNQPIEQGYNTDGRKLEFDENKSPQFTRSLLLSSVPTVNKDGTLYREFLLDINQRAGLPGGLLSLDTIEVYLADRGDRLGYAGWGNPIFDLDDPTDNWVLLDSNLNPGSGAGDVLVYIPNALFTGGDYVYLYSKFGESEGSAYPNTGGFEEWAVRKRDVPPPATVPAPGALLLSSLGVSLLGALRLRRLH